MKTHLKAFVLMIILSSIGLGIAGMISGIEKEIISVCIIMTLFAVGMYHLSYLIVKDYEGMDRP